MDQLLALLRQEPRARRPVRARYKPGTSGTKASGNGSPSEKCPLEGLVKEHAHVKNDPPVSNTQAVSSIYLRNGQHLRTSESRVQRRLLDRLTILI